MQDWDAGGEFPSDWYTLTLPGEQWGHIKFRESRFNDVRNADDATTLLAAEFAQIKQVKHIPPQPFWDLPMGAHINGWTVGSHMLLRNDVKAQTVLHEFGHRVGLNHEDPGVDWRNLMYIDYDSRSRRTLQFQADIFKGNGP